MVARHSKDEAIMREALDEARKGIGKTAPNPVVGAVIAQSGKILARGWHRAAGLPHAEIEAFKALPEKTAARGATLYVTLEPCSTHGKTPPCTEAIKAAGIARVVYGSEDPNPRHAGRGRAVLEQAGIEVACGVLGGECEALNRSWNKWIRTGLPYVTAKCGMTLDGRIGSPPGRRWITSDAARRDLMRLRAECGAILIGAETARVDNPSLTVRGVRVEEQPWRVVWSRRGSLDPRCLLLTDENRGRTLVYERRSLRDVLKDLGRRGVEHVLIEGGGRTLGEAFDRRLVDRVVFYVAPVLTGGAVPAVGGRGANGNETGIRLINPVYKRVGSDLKITADVAPGCQG